uniref:Olfactory receptor class A related 4 n=1 Tax=Latimeria chalumnae TaxID=7897 RepID=H3BIQ7_LATCH
TSLRFSADNVFYGILVLLGIVGNLLVVVTITVAGYEVGTILASDFILANLAIVNFLISTIRNVPLFISDLGLKIYLSRDYCKIFMFLWVWLRSVSIWATFCISFFHFLVIRRHHFSVLRKGKELRNIIITTSVIWIGNFFYAFPTCFYSTRAYGNETDTIQLLSATTRPFLGCIWKFPSLYSGVAYATASLVIHEVFPIFLMVVINLGTLYILYRHSRAVGVETLVTRVASERRAAKVILILVTLFVICWVTNVLMVNYNHNTEKSIRVFVMLANFGASLFIGFSPVVLMVGHSKLRKKLMNFTL